MDDVAARFVTSAATCPLLFIEIVAGKSRYGSDPA